MAIANSDGSIILTTKVDTSGIKTALKQINGDASKTTNVLGKISSALALAFSIKKIIQFSNESAKLATQTEASVQRLIDIYGSASDVVGDFIDVNARALGMSKAAAASFSSVYGNLFSVWADQATNAELTNRYLNMTAVIASKTGRTVTDVQERVRSGLLGNTEAIEDLGVFVNVKTIEMTDAFQRMANGKSWEQLDAYMQQQIRTMAILEQATAKYGDEVAETSATIRSRYDAAYQDFKNSWGAIVNTVLLPVLKMLTQLFDIATRGLNAISGISGNILENTEQTAENIEKQVENQKELNKELKKSLAGFDEIQILSAKTTENTSGGVDVGLQGLGDISSVGETYKQDINDTLNAIMAIAGGALLALGIILLWIGGVVATPIAIGMIIAGGASIVSSVALQAVFAPEDIKAWLSLIMGIAGGALLALGIILCMVGSTAIGVSMIVAGAISLVTVVALNFNLLSGQIEGWCAALIGIIGAATLVIGIILVATGANVPLGLALIITGLTTTVPAILNYQSIVDWVKNAWEAVKAFWNANIAPVFTSSFWEKLGTDCMNGLIAGFEAGINGIVWAFESMINWIVDGLNSISFDMPEWLGGGHFGINIPRASLGRVSIPRLAQGAVIPGNREFLAVLGDQPAGQTNIEAPLQTIVDAFNIALNNRGNDTVKEEHYYLDENEVMRIIYKLAKKGEQAQGADLIESW